METYYLVDLENVHNKGIENINYLTDNDHVHIFSTTENAKFSMNVAFTNVDTEPHVVPSGDQSLDKHLLTYLGFLLAMHGKQNSYVIISNDKGYDNIIKAWKNKGYMNISRSSGILESPVAGKTTERFSGTERMHLNMFVQQHLLELGYVSETANKICKLIIAHCNDEQALKAIHHEIQHLFSKEEWSKVYGDAKSVLQKFTSAKKPTSSEIKKPAGKTTKNGKAIGTNETAKANKTIKIAKPTNTERKNRKNAEIQSFIDRHLKRKIYTDKKKELIKILQKVNTRQELNNELMRLYNNGAIVKQIYKTVQPLVKDLPGQ